MVSYEIHCIDLGLIQSKKEIWINSLSVFMYFCQVTSLVLLLAWSL